MDGNFAIENINTHAKLQMRESVDEGLIEDLKALYLEDREIEPIKVCFLDKMYVIDGHHRLEAAKRAGKRFIKAVICPQKSVLSALSAGMQANSVHGVRLKKEDYLKAMKTILDIDPEMTIKKLAGILCVSTSSAGRYRDELSQLGKVALPDTVSGEDGKRYPVKYAKREAKPDGNQEESVTTSIGRLDDELEEKSEEKPQIPSNRLKPAQEKKPSPMVKCANGECRKMVSEAYLKDDDCEWVFVDCKWFCSSEHAGRETSFIAETDMTRKVENSQNWEGVEVPPCPICGAEPEKHFFRASKEWCLVCFQSETHTLTIFGKTRKECLKRWKMLQGEKDDG